MELIDAAPTAAAPLAAATPPTSLISNDEREELQPVEPVMRRGPPTTASLDERRQSNEAAEHRSRPTMSSRLPEPRAEDYSFKIAAMEKAKGESAVLVAADATHKVEANAVYTNRSMREAAASKGKSHRPGKRAPFGMNKLGGAEGLPAQTMRDANISERTRRGLRVSPRGGAQPQRAMRPKSRAASQRRKRPSFLGGAAPTDLQPIRV